MGAVRMDQYSEAGEGGLGLEDYLRLAALLNARLGIKLPPNKRGMLEMRLRPRIRELGFADHSAYCRHIFRGDALRDEMQHLVDAVTTNKTDFFREADHFQLLRDELVPAILKARRSAGIPLVKLWSAASSTGAEAYTMAMVLEEMRRAGSNFRYAILGTDVSANVIEQATSALYAREMVAPVPAGLKERYLLSSIYGGSGAVMRVVPELRQRVRFALLNLMDETYPVDRDVDIIFLRNVLIYFERPDQLAVIERLMTHLRPSGVLVLGHAEAAIGTSMGLDEIASGVFRKGMAG